MATCRDHARLGYLYLGGQVIPSLDMVVVRSGKDLGPRHVSAKSHPNRGRVGSRCASASSSPRQLEMSTYFGGDIWPRLHVVRRARHEPRSALDAAFRATRVEAARHVTLPRKRTRSTFASVPAGTFHRLTAHRSR